MPPRTAARRLTRRVGRFFWPSQTIRITWEGKFYSVVWLGLMGIGLRLQINLILLTAALVFGPLFGSWFVSAAVLRGLKATRRVPPFAFAGEPMAVDYALENGRSWTAALALDVRDILTPADRAVSGAGGLAPRAFFARVPAAAARRVRWQGVVARRGRYRFGSMILATRGPFGLLERRAIVAGPQDLIVYPAVGKLSRHWQVRQREATESSRGKRQDRSTQQREYHGLREYRPGDSPRWIHWRTTARVGKPMVKEFEQHQDQDLAVLIDPWLPRTKVTAEQREALEAAVGFAATVCLETSRHPGRRLVLGWTGSPPQVRQGTASVRLLHELLEQLAVLRPTAEGHLSGLLDALPAATLRSALLILVTTRPVNLLEEAERSAHLAGAAVRGLAGRVMLLDAGRGDLDGLIRYDGSPGEFARPPASVPASASAPGPGPAAEPRP